MATRSIPIVSYLFNRVAILNLVPTPSHASANTGSLNSEGGLIYPEKPPILLNR